MQKIAAYLLERKDDLQWPDARAAEAKRIRAVIERWLAAKGASPGPGGGAYAAVDGSEASYRVTNAVDGNRSWAWFELTEINSEGRKFVANVSVTVGHLGVFVFITMEVGSVATQINRIDVNPLCPKVVRDLLAVPGNWYHGASRLRMLTRVDGFDAGELLALEIQNAERTVPFVVVSRTRDRVVLPKLDEKLAFDLAGVANVYTIDEEASWALTDALRQSLSCYGGSLRIYWPKFSVVDAPHRHHLWTAVRLQSADIDESAALERIRRQMRNTIMRASSASVVRPPEIDDIRGAATRAEYEALKKNASSLGDFEKLADSYLADIAELQTKLAAREVELELERGNVLRLEADNRALRFHLGRAEEGANEDTELEPDGPPENDGDRPPAPGEVRFYKKHHSSATRDVMLSVADCGHSAWQSATKADKAKKGIEHFEGGKRYWKSIQHCGTCTGGGMWRVQW